MSKSKLEIMYIDAPGYWKGKKGITRQKYPTTPDKDLNFNKGKEIEIIELLEFELGRTKEELQHIINAL